MPADMSKNPPKEPINGHTPSGDDRDGSSNEVRRSGIKAMADVWPVSMWYSTGYGATVQIGESIVFCDRCRSLMIAESPDWEWQLECETCNDSEYRFDVHPFRKPS